MDVNDRPWFKSYDPGTPYTLEPYPQRTVLDVIDDSVRQRPSHTALIFKGHRMSDGELAALTDAFASALVAHGVKKGDRVALLLPNSPQAVIAQIGAWKAGAIVCPLNPTYTERELEHALNGVSAETVVVLNPFYAKVKSLQPRTVVTRVIATSIKEHLPLTLKVLFTLVKEKKEGYRITLQAGDLWMRDVIAQHAGRRADVAVGPQDPAILLFSGGTTGTPKAALGTHQALLMAAMQLRAYAGPILQDWTDTLTWVMPNFHVYGNMAMITSFVARWPMAIVPNPRDIDDLVKTIEGVRPACLHGVPTLFIALLNHPRVAAGKADFTSLKMCWSGAAPLMAETKRRFEAVTGGFLLEAYGMTETMLAAVACPTRSPYKEGSTGVPLPDVDLKIVDVESGEREVGVGQVGEIIIRAPQIMVGYWESPADTDEMIRSGWVHTGDIAHCRSSLAAYKVPRLIEFRDALPKTMIGKVLRRELVASETRSSRSE